MNQTSSDYIRQHGLIRKYGLGLAVIGFAAVGSLFNGDPGSLTTLKMMIAIPFVIAWTWLPTIFDPVRSRTPFTPSFVERTLIEGLLLALAISIVNWTPDYAPLRMVISVTVTTAVYFGLFAVAYRWFIPNQRK